MALTAVDYHVLESLRKAALLPPRPAVLELGESNWYGDIPPPQLGQIIDEVVADGTRREALHERLRVLLAAETPYRSWDLAKLFYAVMLDYSELVAIDFHGTPEAKRIDLNGPVDLGRRFDVVIDGGTAEHVFNVYQFFKSCHDLTRPGGLMLHNNPYRGWLEHGFYNFNSTLYWDLAGANRYEMLLLVYHENEPVKIVQLTTREKIVDMVRARELGVNAMLYAVYRKPVEDAPFVVPWQGYYSGALSDRMMEAWYDLR